MSSLPLTSSTRLQRNEGAVAAEMDGETVMMDIDKGTYFALNGTGTHIWAALETPTTVAEIIEALRETYDTSAADELEAEVTAFLNALCSNDLVLVAE